ncbi:MAG: hypothetical protein NZ853_06790 [Leptospiraceae bacterium]|nr:hypothetical protein [Leptospiraceae bacterium]MDW7975860.1 hypothetical protein [Leptospiraceae bacterium]
MCLTKTLIPFVVFFLSFALNADTFVNLYFLNSNYFQKESNIDFFNKFYKNKKELHARGKEFSLFFLDFTINNNPSLYKEKEYYHILSNVLFDFGNFIEQEQIIKENESELKKYKDKLICFNCSERFSYLYSKFKFLNFQNIKIGILHFRDCRQNEKELEKFLNMHKDTNLWIISSKEECSELNIFMEWIDEAVVIFFMSEKKESFYKQKKIFYCYSLDKICFLTLKLREGLLLNIESNFLDFRGQ